MIPCQFFTFFIVKHILSTFPYFVCHFTCTLVTWARHNIGIPSMLKVLLLCGAFPLIVLPYHSFFNIWLIMYIIYVSLHSDKIFFLQNSCGKLATSTHFFPSNSQHMISLIHKFDTVEKALWCHRHPNGNFKSIYEREKKHNF